MKHYIYIRVSTDKQEYDRQINLFNEHGYELEVVEVPHTLKESTPYPNTIISKREDVEIYFETYSAKTSIDRKELQELLSVIKKDDIVVVSELSRLARSLKDLLDIMETINNIGAGFLSLKDRLDLTTPMGKLMFNMIGAFNQFERDIISERTKEGLEASRNNGVKLGRPAVHNHKQIVADYLRDDKVTYRDLAKKYDISIGNIGHIMKKYNVDVKKRKIIK